MNSSSLVSPFVFASAALQSTLIYKIRTLLTGFRDQVAEKLGGRYVIPFLVSPWLDHGVQFYKFYHINPLTQGL